MCSIRARFLLATFALVFLCGAGTTPNVLPQDAYVWQRKWTPALRVALERSSDIVRTWRVLAAYSYEGGDLQPVGVDWNALKDTGRPVIAVVRIDGQLPRWDDNRLLNDLDRLLSQWRHADAPIAGLEIDHDCAVAKLAMYAQFLVLVRSHLDPKLSLSITALPPWLRSPELGAVLAPVIFRMVLRRGAALIVAGISIGLLASYGLTRFLASQIWGVSATDPWTFASVLSLIVAAGLAACYLPACRATQVDPLVALRYE